MNGRRKVEVSERHVARCGVDADADAHADDDADADTAEQGSNLSDMQTLASE